MRKRIIYLSIGLILFGIAGCDNFKALTSNKKAQGIKERSTSAVKGTIVAKVNNIPITLEDLNLEIDTYNASVPADKPELKITTREKKINYLKFP